jgi:hypothetical protein
MSVLAEGVGEGEDEGFLPRVSAAIEETWDTLEAGWVDSNSWKLLNAI